MQSCRPWTPVVYNTEERRWEFLYRQHSTTKKILKIFALNVHRVDVLPDFRTCRPTESGSYSNTPL